MVKLGSQVGQGTYNTSLVGSKDGDQGSQHTKKGKKGKHLEYQEKKKKPEQSRERHVEVRKSQATAEGDGKAAGGRGPDRYSRKSKNMAKGKQGASFPLKECRTKMND